MEMTITKFQAMFKEEATEVFRRFVLEAHDILVSKSPVDTGYFSNNWHVTTGQPPASDTGPGAGKLVASRLTFGETATVYNNTAYGLLLEYGSSKQAPDGVVRPTALYLSDSFV